MPYTNRITLTDRTIAGAKTTLYDTLVPGLLLRVRDSGRRVFYVVYRDAAGKQRWVVVRDPALVSHEYPILTLARARELARAILEAAGTGRDPVADRAKADQARRTARTHTFGALCDEYLEKWAKPRKKTWRDDALEIRTQLGAWKDRPVVSIRRRDVRELLDAMVARGAPVRANRTLSLISKILNFGLDREWVEANVAAKMAKPTKETPRTRKLTAAEIAKFWEWAEREPPAKIEADVAAVARWRLNRALLQLRLVTAQRGIELLGMQWSDLDWGDDEAGAWWMIPKTKNGQAQRIPLTAPAVTILRDLQTRTRDLDGYVFAGILSTRDRHDMLADVPIKNFQPKDLRRTVATELATLGVDRFTIARVLNHTDRSITAVYDVYAYGPQKRAALDQWAARLALLTTPPPSLRIVR
jgi:integrase